MSTVVVSSALPVRDARWRVMAAALRVMLALAAVVGVSALAIRLAAGDSARELLDFDFAGVTAEPATAAAIFAHNLRVLGGVLVACLVVQLGQRDAGDGLRGIVWRVLAAACDGALLASCAVNALLVGAALGAYGARTVAATMAHGPFELVAFALALGLYVVARRAPLPPRMLATTALASVALLALAAVLEAFA